MQNEKIGVFTDDTLILMVDGSVKKFGDIHVEDRFREVMTSSGPAKVIAESQTPPKNWSGFSPTRRRSSTL